MFQVVVLRDKAPVFMQKAAFEPQCVAIHPGLTEVAVGGMDVSAHKITSMPDFSDNFQTARTELSQDRISCSFVVTQ